MNLIRFNPKEYKKLVKLDIKANYPLYFSSPIEIMERRLKHVLDFYLLQGFETTKRYLNFEIQRSKANLNKLHEMIKKEQGY